MKVQLYLDFEASVIDALREKIPNVVDYRIISRSLDARGINRGKRPKFNYVIDAITDGESFLDLYGTIKGQRFAPLKNPPIIVGAGPAGLFCALALIDCGIPSIILERGRPANERMKDIASYWRHGELNPESNVCYGEGGAGLFSDGKLITRIKSIETPYVMKRLVDFGAPKETEYVTNPHLGSNKMRGIIRNLSSFLVKSGCTFKYNTRVDEVITLDGVVKGVKTSAGVELYSDHVVLATGHSSREIYSHLQNLGVSMKPKDFAVGLRVEHPRDTINRLQHGAFKDHPLLGTARYRLSSHNDLTDRGAYSFCMCPGGVVLSSGTDQDGIVTNGMSNYAQNTPWSNSAIIVSVKSGIDFCKNPTDSVLDGFNFQRQIERAAFNASKEFSNGRSLPALTLKGFLDDKFDKLLNRTSVPSGIFASSFNNILPKFIIEELKRAFVQYDRNLHGFICDEAMVMAPETRTSSPICILRDKESFESVSIKGLYPAGEGAGYAGGITSSAVDGVNVAINIMKKVGLL